MAQLNKTYFAVKDETGSLISGRNSQTNGLYETEGRALQPLKREIKKCQYTIDRYQRYCDINQNAPIHDYQGWVNIIVSRRERLRWLGTCRLVKVVVSEVE